MRINGYLAIKYGITLDQTPAQSYYALDWNGTAGIASWDATASGLYNKDIAGIARDDKGALLSRWPLGQLASAKPGRPLSLTPEGYLHMTATFFGALSLGDPPEFADHVGDIFVARIKL